MLRAGSVLVFFAGVACLVVFGCVLAAHDLWGGVPREQWPTMQRLVGGGVVGLVLGAVGYLRSHAPGTRLRAALWATLALALLATLLGGALFAHYAGRREPSRKICLVAHTLPTLVEREQALAEGLGPLFPVIDPHSECIALKRELDRLENEQRCPLVVLDAVPCRCGASSWPGSGPACADGPTTCEYRPDLKRDGLGCAGEYNARRLAEAAALRGAP